MSQRILKNWPTGKLIRLAGQSYYDDPCRACQRPLDGEYLYDISTKWLPHEDRVRYHEACIQGHPRHAELRAREVAYALGVQP